MSALISFVISLLATTKILPIIKPTPPPPIDCGVIHSSIIVSESDTPKEIRQEAFQCFQNAFNECKPAKLVDISYGFEGDAMTNQLEVIYNTNPCIAQKTYVIEGGLNVPTYQKEVQSCTTVILGTNSIILENCTLTDKTSIEENI
jgi:hypothetical protein